MESNSRNTSNSASAKGEHTQNAAVWPKFARRALLSVAFLACATAAIQAHDIYSGLLNKEGKRCCNESDCRPAQYKVEQRVQMFVDGIWIAIPEDRIQYAHLHGDSGGSGGAHWCGWNDPNEGMFTNCAILPPSSVMAKPETPELVGRFVRLDGGPPLVRRISSRGETFATQDFPVRVTADGRVNTCLRPDPEGELGVTCLLFPYPPPGGP